MPAAIAKSADVAAPAPISLPGDVAGWNGEHFFIGSRDGQFQLNPIGYLNANYTVYDGDGAPPDGFALKRARFGFQGMFGKQIDYTLLADIVATGVTVRDAYVTFKPRRAFQIRLGQFKEPFSEEVGIADTNLEFFDRSLVSALYPSASGSYRSPGAMVFGDFDSGVFDYWLGAFNGRGILTPAASDYPEFIGRLRFTPLRWTNVAALAHLSLGASVGLARSVALAGDQSFSGVIKYAPPKVSHPLIGPASPGTDGGFVVVQQIQFRF
jgi:hypothetical protein